MSRIDEPMVCTKEMSLITLSHNLENHSRTLTKRLNNLLDTFEGSPKCESGELKKASGPPEDIFSTLHRTYDKLDNLINTLDRFQNRIGYFKEIEPPMCASLNEDYTDLAKPRGSRG